MMEEKFSLENDIRVSTLSRYPEVLTMEEKMDDEEELWKGLKKALMVRSHSSYRLEP